MTDINKQIEEKAIEYSNYALAQDGYIKGYQSALHSSRWRKVSEELPEYGDIVVAKGDTSDFQDMYLIEIDSDYSMSVLTSYYKEWKSID